MELEGKPLQKQEVTITLPGDPKARTSLSGTAPVGPSQAGFDGLNTDCRARVAPIRSEFSLPMLQWLAKQPYRMINRPKPKRSPFPVITPACFTRGATEIG